MRAIMVAMREPPTPNRLDSTGIPDEISGGPSSSGDRRLPRWMVAAVAAGVAIAVTSWALVRHDTRHLMAAERSSPPAPGWHSYSTSPNGPTESPAPPLPTNLPGLPLAARTGLVLPYSGTVPGWWDADSGTLTPITPPPPPQANGYGFNVVPRASGFAALRNAGEPCDGCPGKPTPVQLAVAHQPARQGPPANAIAPAADADGIWVTSYRFPAIQIEDPRQSAVVQLIDVSGHVRMAPRDLPRNSYVIRGVRGGLLLTRSYRKAATAFLWDPLTGRTGFRLSGEVVDATSELIVWQQSADCSLTSCDIHVRNLVTETQRTFTNLAGEVAAVEGATSPDGRYFALREYGDPDRSAGGEGNLTSTAVAVLDLRTGRTIAVPGSKIANSSGYGPGYSAIGWTPDGRYLIVQSGDQPALWRVGAPVLLLTAPLSQDVVLVPP